MSKKYNVLLLAYACEPFKGSEPGVGWNFAIEMSKKHNIWVLTRKNNKETIEKEISKIGSDNINFIYFDLPSKLMLIKKLFGVQFYYLLWQFFSFIPYIKISKIIKFDLIHHLTFNQYRSLSFAFFSKVPFVIGPVGGAECINKAFFKDLNMKTKIKEFWRKLGLDILLFKFLVFIGRNRKTLVFSSDENYKRLKINNKITKSIVIPAIAINKQDFNFNDESIKNNDKFTIVYVGRAEDWKGLSLFLKSLNSAFNQSDKILIKLIGIRHYSEKLKIKEWISLTKLSDKIELIDFIQRDKLLQIFRYANLSVYPAFRDSGSMAVLESCALGCPVICFAVGGQDIFPDEIIFKLKVSSSSYQENVFNLAEKLKWAYNSKQELNNIGLKAKDYVYSEFTWSKKILDFVDVYSDLIEINK